MTIQNGRTALLLAADIADVNTVEVLLGAGADIFLTDVVSTCLFVSIPCAAGVCA